MFGIVRKDGNNNKYIHPLTSDVGAGAPVGSLAMMYKKSAPDGYLYCDGSTFDSAQYPALYMYLGTNVLPDYREFAPVGAEQNNTETIAAHDVYTEGEAKDDQVQDHTHGLTQAGSSATGAYIQFISSTAAQNRQTNSMATGRAGTVTRGKRKAVFFYIKATSGLVENQQENVLNQINTNNSYSETEQPTGAKWIDGKPIYRKVITYSSDLVIPTNTWTDTTMSNSNIAVIISACGINGTGALFPIGAAPDAASGYVTVISYRPSQVNLRKLVFEYTKTS